MKLTVVRHGETIENANNIIMGQHGGTLSEKGIIQVKELAKEIKNEKFDQAWSSDLKRCVDTASYIVGYHPSLKLQVTTALREVNYGKFQGRPSSEIRPLFEQSKDIMDVKIPGGETQREMYIRAIGFVNKLLKDFPEQSVLLVAHTGPIEAIRSAIEKTPFSGDVKNASIWRRTVSKPLKLYPGS